MDLFVFGTGNGVEVELVVVVWISRSSDTSDGWTKDKPTLFSIRAFPAEDGVASCRGCGGSKVSPMSDG